MIVTNVQFAKKLHLIKLVSFVFSISTRENFQGVGLSNWDMRKLAKTLGYLTCGKRMIICQDPEVLPKRREEALILRTPILVL